MALTPPNATLSAANLDHCAPACLAAQQLPTHRCSCPAMPVRRGDERMQQRRTEEDHRQVAIDAEIDQQRRHGTQQQASDQRTDPVVGAADDRQRKQHHRFARRERAPVELADGTGEQRTGDAGADAGEAEGPGLVQQHVARQR